MSTLRRTLGTVEAFGLSLSIIAPTVAMAFVTTLSGQAAGRAVPLTFLIGAVAVALIGLSFVAFGRRVAHAGSVYAYIGQVFGQRWGFIAGWLLLLSYIAFTAGVTAVAGDFAAAGLAHAGITFSGLWLLVSAAAAVIGICFAWNDTRIAVRLMLVLETVSMLAILVLAVVILTQVPLSPLPLIPDTEHGWSGVGFGLVFAITSFAGFEGAATLGEETQNPKRAIPVAIIGTVAIAGLFYVVVSYAQVVGYGLDHMQALAQSKAPLDERSTRFISGGFAAVIDLAAAASAIACALGCLSAAARMLYALGRAGLSPALGRAHPRHRTPTRAILVVGGINLASLALWGSQTGFSVFSSALVTIGTLALIVVYMSVTAAEAVIAFRHGRAIWGVTGALGTLLLLWPLWNSVYPVPEWPGSLWPYLVGAWLIIGVVLVLARPLMREIDLQAEAAD